MKNSGVLTNPRKLQVSARGNTAKLISAYYLDIEYLLDLVERSATHYQVLGLERSATNEEIIGAYHRTVTMLHPSYYKVRAAVPDEMLIRIDQTFNKASQAFYVLTDNRRRMEYDQSLQRKAVTPLPLEIPIQQPAVATPEKTATEKASPTNSAQQPLSKETIDIKVQTSQQVVYTKPSAEAEAVNRRRCERFKLGVPTLVAGYATGGGKWQEVTRTLDVSRMGVGLHLRKQVRHGAVLHVTLPLPTKLRSHGFSEPGYNMYALVRRVEPAKDGTHVVGLEFLGAHPPAGYLYKPWATFRTQRWTGAERRRDQREDRTESVVVQYLDDTASVVAQEVAVTENISPGGARIVVKTAPAHFEVVRIISGKRAFESIASVRNRFTSSDSFERLCLQFIQHKWPMLEP